MRHILLLACLCVTVLPNGNYTVDVYGAPASLYPVPPDNLMPSPKAGFEFYEMD